MAPLLFPNLVALALIGIWELAIHLPVDAAQQPGVFDRMIGWAASLAPETQASDRLGR